VTAVQVSSPATVYAQVTGSMVAADPAGAALTQALLSNSVSSGTLAGSLRAAGVGEHVGPAAKFSNLARDRAVLGCAPLAELDAWRDVAIAFIIYAGVLTGYVLCLHVRAARAARSAPAALDSYSPRKLPAEDIHAERVYADADATPPRAATPAAALPAAASPAYAVPASAYATPQAALSTPQAALSTPPRSAAGTPSGLMKSTARGFGLKSQSEVFLVKYSKSSMLSSIPRADRQLTTALGSIVKDT
jgi:hypothetical protein